MSLAIRQATAVARYGSAGDPGLGSFIKKVGGGLVKAAGGFLAGGPLGAAAGLASSFVGGGKPQAMPGGVPVLPPAQGFNAQQFGVSPGSIRVGPVQISTPGIQFPGFGPGVGGVGAPQGASPGRGMRLNKSGYWLRSGQYIAPGTRWVKVRRRNPLNPRALSRSMSRLTGFKRAAEAASRITVRSGCGCRKR